MRGSAPEGPAYGLRDAGPRDARQIARVLGDWSRETPWMPKLHTREDELSHVRGLLVTHGVRIRFAGGAGFLARRSTEVDMLYLAPPARGQGLGRALLAEAKAEGHLTLWTFQANLRARAFYRREGFQEVAFTDGARNDEKLPDVRLEWLA